MYVCLCRNVQMLSWGVVKRGVREHERRNKGMGGVADVASGAVLVIMAVAMGTKSNREREQDDERKMGRGVEGVAAAAAAVTAPHTRAQSQTVRRERLCAPAVHARGSPPVRPQHTSARARARLYASERGPVRRASRGEGRERGRR